MYKTEGFVLRTRNFGEADKIVTLYTKHNGKVGAVARGSRRIRNRLLGATQVFTHGRYLLFKGKNLDTLSQAELINSNQILRDDLEKMAHAMYIAELLDLLTEEGEPQLEVFSLLVNTFALGQSGRFPLATLGFELRLMRYLGYEPQLENCFQCGKKPHGQLGFSAEGGVVCGDCRSPQLDVLPLSRGTYEIMKPLLNWEYNRLNVLHPSSQAMGELARINRRYLDYRLERPVKSLEFLQSLTQTKEVKSESGQ